MVCKLTARQYGEVVLPDASTGQSPGTPRQRSQKTVTVQGGYGMCFCSPGTKLAEHYECRGTSYLTNGELSRYCYFVNSCGAVRICQALRFCLGGRSKSKNRDKQLTHIVRVMRSIFLIQFSLAVMG